MTLSLADAADQDVSMFGSTNRGLCEGGGVVTVDLHQQMRHAMACNRLHLDLAGHVPQHACCKVRIAHMFRFVDDVLHIVDQDNCIHGFANDILG